MARVEAKLSRFAIFHGADPAMARQAARNYRLLRRTGFTVRSTLDSLTAAFCLHHGYALLHRDRDFDAFESRLGLRVIHPPESA